MELIIYIKMDLALNNLQKPNQTKPNQSEVDVLICHKTKPNQTKPNRSEVDVLIYLMFFIIWTFSNWREGF